MLELWVLYYNSQILMCKIDFNNKLFLNFIHLLILIQQVHYGLPYITLFCQLYTP